MKSMLIISGSRILTPLFADLFERHGWSVSTCFDRQCAIQRLAGDWLYDSILVGGVSGTDEVQLVGLIRGLSIAGPLLSSLLLNDLRQRGKPSQQARTKYCLSRSTRTSWFGQSTST
jgi:hypothetical protein